MIALKTKHLAAVVPAIFIAGIGLTMAFNLWHTTTTKEPAKYSTGEFAGQANPADIRGSYSFGDVAAAFPGVPLEVLADAFGVTQNPAAFPVKSLETLEGGTSAYALGTDSVRLFVARYLGLAFEPASTTGLPPRAAELLEATGLLDAAGLADVEKRIVGVTAGAVKASPATAAVGAPATAAAATVPAETSAAPAAVTAETAPVVRTVKGSTTFKDLADWGVESSVLDEALGSAPGAPSVTLRNWCTEKGIEFSTVKTKIQALVDAAAP
ncbi:MAG: hypothetical protein A2177_04775 [Spirochaetes bacterium RBG_13_68_11]|nr:MAG: hypothetical protein A2177_04775 [Spirochaetes bacterium RBG_13_68_11]